MKEKNESKRANANCIEGASHVPSFSGCAKFLSSQKSLFAALGEEIADAAQTSFDVASRTNSFRAIITHSFVSLQKFM